MSKRLKIIVLLGISALIALFVLRWLIQRASPMPDNLGVENGRLAPCPDSPNCVSTQASDEEHGTIPIAYEGETAVAHDKILTILNNDPSLTIISQTPTYIHAEARSAVWQFIDDVEFFFNESEGLVHFRSAARLGYGDGGINRQRMETIHTEFEAMP